MLRSTPLNIEAIRTATPVQRAERLAIALHRRDIRNILDGSDPRFLVLCGPCSAWPSEAVREYAERLAPYASRYGDKLKLVMRVYTQKPRTTTGWAGVIVQPDPYKTPNIARGAHEARRMMQYVTRAGLAIADELLFTHKIELLGDFLSYAAIGARSSEDHEHRVHASGLALPVGLKNPTSGDIRIGVNSVVSARAPHTYLAHARAVHTNGNPYAHLILRGGSSGPNYSIGHVHRALSYFAEHTIEPTGIIIDASHDNARRRGTKRHDHQVPVVHSVLRARARDEPYRRAVRGIMFESFLHPGNQSLDAHTANTIDRSGRSITDPCLGWDDTVRLLAYIYDHV